MERQRPIGVNIFGILLLIFGLLELIFGVEKQSSASKSISNSLLLLEDIVTRIIGILFLISSIGLFRRFELARKLTVALCILTIFWINIDLFTTYSKTLLNPINLLISIIIFGIPIFYFTRIKVKEQFR